MTDYLQWGLNFLQETRHQHMTQEVLIGFSEEEAVPLQATLSETDTLSITRQVGLHSQYFDFIFRKSDLVEEGIEIQRGLRIWYNDLVYEIAFQGRLLFYYNDPMELDVVIQTVKITPQITPNPPYPHSNQEANH